MTETQALVEISSRSAAELAEKYMALWNEPDADRRRLMTPSSGRRTRGISSSRRRRSAGSRRAPGSQ